MDLMDRPIQTSRLPSVNRGNFRSRGRIRSASGSSASSGNNQLQAQSRGNSVSRQNNIRGRGGKWNARGGGQQGSTQSSQRRGGSGEFLMATICAVQPNCVFVKPHSPLPEQYNQNKDIFVKKPHFGAFADFVKTDDTVEVLLGYHNVGKPEAIKASIVEVKGGRDSSEVSCFFDKLTDILRTNNLSPANVENTVKLLKATPVWVFLFNYLGKGNSLEILDSKICVANEVAKLSKHAKYHVKNFFSFIIGTRAFDPLFLGARNSEVSFRSRTDKVKQFFENVTLIEPEKAGQLLPFMEALCKDSSDITWIKCIKNIIRGTTNDFTEFRLLEWDELPNIPFTDEVLGKIVGNDRRLLPVLVGSPYDSVTQYLDTYYRLLREDCFSSLKTGIQDLMENKLDERDMNVYRNVRFKGISLTESGFIFILSLDQKYLGKRQRIKTSDLQFGNLVCITVSGSFSEAIWTTVYMREKEVKSDGSFGFALELAQCGNDTGMEQVIQQLVSGSGNLNVVESPTYFRAYEPVLTNLKTMDSDNFAFKSEIVDLRDCSKGPVYINEMTKVNCAIVYPNLPIVPFRNFERYLVEYTSPVLDGSQKDALLHILKHRVSMVQGPPGCGKTYLGTKFVNLLVNLDPQPPGPVLLLTYKNHALDEFLKRTLHFLNSSKICRIGGRSEEPELESANLKNIRSAAFTAGSIPAFLKQERIELMENIKLSKNVLCEALEESYKKNRLTCLNFASRYLTSPQIISLMTSMAKPLQITNDLKLKKTVNYGTHLTRDNIVNIIGEAQRRAGVDAKTIVETGDSSIDEVNDFLEVFKKVIQLWIPPEKFVREVEQEFIMNTEDTANANDGGNDGDENDDDDDDKDLEMDRFKVLADSKAFGFKDFSDLTKASIQISNTGNNSEFPCALSLLTFAPKLCQNAPVGLLASKSNMWNMPLRVRLIAIQDCILRSSDDDSESENKISLAFSEYMKYCDAKAQVESRTNAHLLSSRRVIGMTITGASINRHLIDLLQPSVIVVEEAAEVLEPQLAALLKPYVQHLVMIGDHKQLRPSVESHELVKKFNFDVSMMERLIKGNLPFSKLNFQNRMRPDISQYLADIYPDLKNGMKVGVIAEVPQFLKSFIFWNHEFPEKAERSYTNEEEALRCAYLTEFLVGQGYVPSSITILAAYKGQKGLVRKKLEALQKKTNSIFPKELDRSKKVQVQTIDMYQGDENEIVIVSLTRSNDKGRIGFMKELNRRCVAQSRAKRIVIFVGNFSCFQNQPKWTEFAQAIMRNGAVSSALEIKCPKPEHSLLTRISITDSSHFPPSTFCKQICKQNMNCGLHTCPKLCQPSHQHEVCEIEIDFVDRSKCVHERVRKCCQHPNDIACNKSCAHVFTPCNHQCGKKCEPNHEHLQCNKIVKYHCRACSNELKRKCHQNVSEVKCTADVTVYCATCTTKGTKVCHESMTMYKCQGNCIKILKCKHLCARKCSEVCPDNEEHCPQCQELKRVENERKNKELIQRNKELAKKFSDEIEKAKTDQVSTFSRVEIFKHGQTHAEFQTVEDLVLKSVQQAHSWYPRITKIEKVKNSELSAKFHESVMQMFDPSYIDQKFHVTNTNAVDAIVKTGFKLPENAGMYGAGVYLTTDSSKSAQEIYTKGSNILLVCRAGLGRTKTVNSACTNMNRVKLHGEKYDSLYAPRNTKGTGGVLFDEFVIFDPFRVLPEYIVHYSKSTVGDLPLVSPHAMNLRSSSYKRIQLELKREVTDPITQNYMMAAAQFYSLTSKPEYKGPRNLTAIYYHSNPVLETQFYIECQRMKAKYTNEKGEPILAFHGTPNDANIESIAKNNFSMSSLRKCAHGWGVYLSEHPDVSLGYARGTQKLLLCKVLPGESHDGDCRRSGPGRKCGCDSHRIGGDQDGRGWAIVMFDMERILPCFELHLS